MGTCKQCRWWDTQSAFSGEAQPFECLNPKLKARPICEPGDGFGQISDVATFADFGCIQYEAQEARHDRIM